MVIQWEPAVFDAMEWDREEISVIEYKDVQVKSPLSTVKWVCNFSLSFMT